MPQVLVVGGYASSKAGERTYIAQLDGHADFAAQSLMARGADRKVAVVTELQRVNALAMQGVAPALDALRSQGLISSYEVSPLTNTVVYNVPEARAADAWQAMNAVAGVGHITRDREVHLIGSDVVVPSGAEVLMTVPDAAPTVEWNVDRVHAPEVWADGFRGQGVVVGIVDTGVDVSHEQLHAKYRGTNADGTQTDDYNFHDEVNHKTAPYDDNEHGTHVSGTVLGSTDGRDVGMAPDAKFIASKILSGSGSGTLAGVTKGLAWMLAPTDSKGMNPDPTKAPDIVSNSWGSNNGKDESFRGLLQSFLAAGIEPVFAAGNAGPRPGSVGTPGSNPEVISVAATDNKDVVASFSSRGPSPIKDANGSDHKPDIAAPGVNITSAKPGGGYQTMSGTSMATPAVAGVIALLLSKHHDLSHDEVLQAITTSAHDLGDAGYDYSYGSGLIDAKAAMAAADAIVAARSVARAAA